MIQVHSLAHLLDDKTVLKNPHKGWYWHYVDNGMKSVRYRDRTDGYDRFPGLNHLYLRVDWSDLQPAPDVYDWSVLDGIMDVWGARGFRFALRVCCSETSAAMCFATPKWLYDMGCPGAFYPPFPDKDPTWWELSHVKHLFRPGEDRSYYERICEQYFEPDYFHPLFLTHLEAFLKAFAARYDGDPRIEYIDMGSYGNWGEGHTSAGSMRRGSFALFKTHVRLHMKYFKKTYILLNDDYVNQMQGNTHEDILRPSEDKQSLVDYCLSCGMGLRDDSILAGPDYHEREYHTVSTPQLFDAFYKQAPVDIEGAHYTSYTDDDSHRGLVLMEALHRCHATFAGFHGYMDDWLRDNPYITAYLANRLGYWYFIHRVAHETHVDPDTRMRLSVTWENRGYAPAYYRYRLTLRLCSQADGRTYDYALADFDNSTIGSEKTVEGCYFADLGDIGAGEYSLALRMSEPTADGELPIRLALKDECRTEDGFYILSTITVNGEETV